MRSTFCLLLICLLTACSQMRYIGIETYNPAEVTYPQDVKKILIVNNAVPQPSDTGYEYKLKGIIQDTCRANADSALYYACRALGNAIVETDFFQDVLLFHENTRKDDAFLTDEKLTQNEVKALCEETGADAVISFDRLLFDMSRTVTNFAEGDILGLINVNILGIVRSYLPSRENPQASIIIEDSLFWAEASPDLKILDMILPTADNALKEAGEFVGGKVYTMFVPHWDRETRWYYTGTGTRWKEATAFAANEKWENAFERWNSIYEKSSGWKSKAKSAANLALYYELSGDIEKAVELAGISYDLFNKNAGEENKNTKNQGAYKTKLLERMRDDRKLNIQIGEE